MEKKLNLDHILIGIGFGVLGTLLGFLLIEAYWVLVRDHPSGTSWKLFSEYYSINGSNFLTFSQVPNVLVFFSFYQTKRDRSAYGVIMLFILVMIPIAVDRLL